MKKYNAVLLVCVFVVILAGCTSTSDKEKISNLEMELSLCKEKIQYIENELESFRAGLESNSEINNMLFNSYLEFARKFGEWAYIELGKEEYQLVFTKNGIVSISVFGIKKAARGSEISVHIINFMGVALSENYIDIEYCDVVPSVDREAYNERMKKYTTRIPTLIPGKPAIVRIVMPEFPPEEIVTFKARVRSSALSIRN